MNEIEIDSGELSATLSLLEIKGVIKEVAGKVQLG
jgi:hypothetical protein